MEKEIPNLAGAIISDEKVTAYLLNLSHPDGRGKAIFFNRKGFNLDNISEFKEMLLEHVRQSSNIKTQKTPWGTKYIVTGSVYLKGENVFNLTSVWIIENGDSFPKLATAYPAPKDDKGI